MPRRKWKIKRFLENEEVLTEDQDIDSKEPEILQRLLPACVSENKWKQTKEIYPVTLAAKLKRERKMCLFLNFVSTVPQQLFSFTVDLIFHSLKIFLFCFYFLSLSFCIIQGVQKLFCFNWCNKGVNIPDVFSAEMPNRVTRCDS